jgi:hydrogenase small subunit
MLHTEFTPGQRRSESLVVHVLWMTAGLSCDGDTVSMTAATNPSLEDLLTGAIPGTPGVVIYNPVLAFETGDDFMRAFHDAARGKLDPFVLVLEGSVPNEEINGEGHWSGFGVDPGTGQPITACTWIDRLAPRAAAVMAIGTCAAYGGVPAMKNNPTGAMGLRDYLGWNWTSRLGIPIVNLPGCPVQPDNATQTLLTLLLQLGQMAPMIDLDDQGRPRSLFDRSVHEGCNRAGSAEVGRLADSFSDGDDCLVKLGCSGPLVKCNVPLRGWVNGMGGCPNVGGICIACTSAGFPDRFLPFMEGDRLASLTARSTRFTYGPMLRYFRERAMRRKYEVEPEWRQRVPELQTGYERRW